MIKFFFPKRIHNFHIHIWNSYVFDEISIKLSRKVRIWLFKFFQHILQIASSRFNGGIDYERRCSRRGRELHSTPTYNNPHMMV